MGIMEKHLPDQSFELDNRRGHDDIGRLFTTTGAGKGETMRAIPVERYVSRPETAISYSGGAGFQNSAVYVPGEYMPSHNQQFGAVPLAPVNANGRNYATDADYEIKAKMAYPNNRTSNRQDDYFGMVGGALGAVVSPLLDVLRPSRRQNVVGNLRTYGDAGTTVASSYVMNPADRAPTTIRETTENAKFHLQSNATALQNGGAYAITKHQPIVNARMNQSVYYAGNSSAGANNRQARNYDAEYRQRNNDIKSSTIDGRMVPGNMALLNNQVNITSQDSASYLTNNRAPAGAMPYGSAPSVDQLGRLQGKQTLYSGAQAERSNGDVLAQLKGNPYALSITR
jgi:hypothetical protein